MHHESLTSKSPAAQRICDSAGIGLDVEHTSTRDTGRTSG